MKEKRTGTDLVQLAQSFKILGNQTRLQITKLLLSKELLSEKEIFAQLQSNEEIVLKELKNLCQDKVLICEKQGEENCYSLSNGVVKDVLGRIYLEPVSEKSNLFKGRLSPATKIFAALFLNFSFAIVELVAGLAFNSGAVFADAVHDVGDAAAIGLAFVLEKYANKGKDQTYHFGYRRLSLLSSVLIAGILIAGSVFTIFENTPKIFQPEPINYRGMLILGMLALIVNYIAGLILSEGTTENEATLSIHFWEDILGWGAVILVALTLRFTDWYFLDPLLSIFIALIILFKALPSLIRNIGLCLERTPYDVDLEQLGKEILEVAAVEKITQLNVWSLDGQQHLGLLHILLKAETVCSEQVLSELHSIFEMYHIVATIEIDSDEESHHKHSCYQTEFEARHHHHH